MGLKAEVLLDLAAGALRARPPAGVDAAYVEGFLARNRDQLLAIVAASFPARPAPPKEPGLRRFQAEHRLARLLLGAVEGRHFGADPRLADLLEGIHAHAVWEEEHLFPALRAAAPAMEAALDHATAEHGLLRRHLVELTAALREGRAYDGPAVALILHHFGEEEAALLALGPDTVLVPALPSALVDAAAEIEALGEELGVETPAGGRRAAVALPPAEWAEGMRVVTEAGDHARIERMRRWERSLHTVTGVIEQGVEHEAILRFDAGRSLSSFGPLFAERRGPTRVVIDVSFDGGRTFESPASAWRRVRGAYSHITTAQAKAEAARKRDQIQRWRDEVGRARELYERLADIFLRWRVENRDVEVPGLEAKDLRLDALELTLGRTAAEEHERALIRKAPRDWAERLVVGDRVLFYAFDGDQPRAEAGFTIAAVNQGYATVERAGEQRVVGLWLLQRDTSTAPPAMPVPAEDVWLVDLGRSLGVGDFGANRAAVAAAVKRYLGENGVNVRTRVERGAWVTSISLEPMSARFGTTSRRQIEALLPGVVVGDDRATFEPSRKEAAEFDPMADYQGKGGGILLPRAAVPRFAAILAGAMRAEGQALSRLGEELLVVPAVAAPVGAPAAAVPRGVAAGGCVDLELTVEGVGLVKVQCGQAGRRDVWHNLWVAGTRYGFNGGRWARGMVPPAAVLGALRERGIGAFG